MREKQQRHLCNYRTQAENSGRKFACCVFAPHRQGGLCPRPGLKHIRRAARKLPLVRHRLTAGQLRTVSLMCMSFWYCAQRGFYLIALFSPTCPSLCLCLSLCFSFSLSLSLSVSLCVSVCLSPSLSQSRSLFLFQSVSLSLCFSVSVSRPPPPPPPP